MYYFVLLHRNKLRYVLCTSLPLVSSVAFPFPTAFATNLSSKHEFSFEVKIF